MISESLNTQMIVCYHQHGHITPTNCIFALWARLRETKVPVQPIRWTKLHTWAGNQQNFGLMKLLSGFCIISLLKFVKKNHHFFFKNWKFFWKKWKKWKRENERKKREPLFYVFKLLTFFCFPFLSLLLYFDGICHWVAVAIGTRTWLF